MNIQGKAIILSAPSGSGKTTLVNHLLEEIPELSFSISATTRKPRDNEKDGVHYFFMTIPEFKSRLKKEDFVEYEEVYKGAYYGTLKSQIQQIWNRREHVVFDVDVKGGVKLKEYFSNSALGMFIQAPNMNILKNRLISRGTESEENLQKRLDKITEEMSYSDQFDYKLINADLTEAKQEIVDVVSKFIKK